MTETRYDTVIVGGGIAGLTSAAYLSRKKQKVLLIEKNRECGGLVNSFSRNGFRFEAGVRALLDAGIIFPMLEELDINLEVVRSKVSVGVEDNIVHIENLNSLDEYQDLLVKTFPDSSNDINNLMKIIRRIMRNMDVLYGVKNPMIKDMWKDKSYLFKKVLPWLPKFMFTIRKINRLKIPVEKYLVEIIQDASLRDIISQHFFKNTPTFFALSYFSLYLDYFYPKGGVGKLAEAIEDKFIESGGEVKRETIICKVIASDKVVIDQEGQAYRYKNLIWAADLKTFYLQTETSGLNNKIRNRFEHVKQQTLEQRGGDSVFSLYLQVDEPLESFRNIAHGHFFYTPSKNGLGETHRSELKKMLDNWENISKDELDRWTDKLTRLNTYEISIPGLKDPKLVPEGKTGLIISFLAEYDLFQKLHQSGLYESYVRQLETKVIEVLSESVYPMLKDRVIARFSFTPWSIKKRIGSSEGAITGWSFENHIPVISEMQKAGRSILTPIPSIYQAGQWTYSPAGVPMSILTGKLAADRILKKK